MSKRTITVTINAPIEVELEVNEINEENIRKTLSDEFRNERSTNHWETIRNSLEVMSEDGYLEIDDNYITLSP